MIKKFKIKDLKAKVPEIKEKLLKLKSEYDKDAIIYTVLLLGIIAYGVPRFLFPAFSELNYNLNEYSTQKKAALIMEQKFKALTEAKNAEKKIPLPIKIFEPEYKDIDLETAASPLQDKIISIIKENGNNTVESFEFEQKDLTDKSGQKASHHAVLSIKIRMKTTYENIQNILNEIYLMNYLVKIKNLSLEADPELEADSVMANMVLELYVKTS